MGDTLNVKSCETFSGLLTGFHDGIFHRREGLSHILPFTSFITIQICSIRINNAKTRSYFICINVYMFIEAFKINIHVRDRGVGDRWGFSPLCIERRNILLTLHNYRILSVT